MAAPDGPSPERRWASPANPMPPPAADAPVRLDLPEEVFLLSLRDDGRFGVAGLQYALGGAILAELAFRDRVAVTGSGRKQRVGLLNASPTGVALYDECLGRVRDSRRPRPPAHWVSSFGVAAKARNRVGERLGERGVLRIERRRVLLVFPSRRHLQIDGGPRREVLLRLGGVVLDGQSDAERRTVALLAVAHGVGLLRFAFGRKAMRPYRAAVKQLVKDDPFGRAVRDAVAAAQAAQAAATTTTTSS